MSDNRTNELRKLLTERGVKWTSKPTRPETTWAYNGWCHNVKFEPWGDSTFKVTIYDLTPEQAIAATLGSEPPYDELLRCLENDWHIRASWDGLRKFWCIELTEEGVRMRDATHGTLTAEQVMAIAAKHQPDYCSDTHVCFDWQAIADELNAELGSETCDRIAELEAEVERLRKAGYEHGWHDAMKAVGR